ncbi:MAG: hypothetical protein WC637_00460 [Victivallales bacterium]|jgi:hypothetical protein
MWIIIIPILGILGFIIYKAVSKKKGKEVQKSADPCAAGACEAAKPADPCAAGTCGASPPSIEVTVAPNNPPYVPAGVFCTRSTSIIATEKLTGINCGDTGIKREWFDNGILVPNNNTKELPKTSLHVNHTITYKVSAEGIEATSKPIRIT